RLEQERGVLERTRAGEGVQIQPNALVTPRLRIEPPALERLVGPEPLDRLEHHRRPRERAQMPWFQGRERFLSERGGDPGLFQSAPRETRGREVALLADAEAPARDQHLRRVEEH